ncbi:MAG: bifunctional UDP-N-acetylglucosamine diphosphorylase/glucosamine-1-phosphate N-acetyltransferase GlmU [Pseudomonadota bacterium]
MEKALIVLAAGQGNRMRSDLPKVLHKVAGAPLLVHALVSGASLAPVERIVVAGHGIPRVRAATVAYDPGIRIVEQAERLGTAHAVAQAEPALKGFGGDVIILYGDTPFIRPETLQAMAAARAEGADVVVLGFEAATPGRYGRLVTKGDRLDRIVEFEEATPHERAIRLCNSGVLMAHAPLLFELTAQVGNDNKTGEYYLTDIVGLANGSGRRCAVVTCPETETMGVNTRADLAKAEAVFQERARRDHLNNGVTLTAPQTVHFAFDTIIGQDAVIGPNVVFGPEVTVESGVTVNAFSHLEGCHVGKGAVVGPFARLRPGARLGDGARIGNFVEIKNARLGEDVKINHLSYIGDAEIGGGTNIGAGTIVCNYDGVRKHRTFIGADAFIGSNSALIAPVRIGNRAMTASGSVITLDVPDDAMAIARAKQVNKPGLATRLMDKLRGVRTMTPKKG